MALVALTLAACSGGDPGPDAAPTTAPEAPAATSAPPDDAAATTEPAPPEAAPSTTAPEPPPEPGLGASGVSAGHPLAAEAGMQMLERGGSAVDAAIAAAFTDAVTQPSSSGIGGGGVTIVAADGEAVNYDYREVVNAQGAVPEDGVGVPGFVAGMHRLHEEHGELPWEVLLEPAITVAEDGHPVSDFVAAALRTPNGEAATGDLPHFRSGGAPLQAGDPLVQTDLAATMRTLAEEGAPSFYTGSLSGRVAGVPGLDARTLQDYEVQVSAPAAGDLAGDVLLSGAPPLPGAAIVQMAQIAEAGGIGEVDPDSAEFVDRLSQAWLVADRTVQEELGDPAFVDVPVERITDQEANAALAADLYDGDGGVAAVADPYDSDPNTTHISVVDEDGVGVSMTNTLTSFWGSGRYLDGYFLNDQLSRFFAIGVSDANQPEAGRRSVSWSAPSMVVDEDYRPVLVVGTPGGRQIPSTTASVVLRWGLHGEPLDAAVPAGRFLLSDGRLRLEDPALAGELRSMGYAVDVADPGRRADFGSVQALAVDWEQGTVTGFADDRRSAGFVVDSP
ncbi:hypothetical protein AVL62_15450 [Serinicoccus chungangensis]|uniref:Gamma-glutamyltransferase n=1 Tax=Serinicoccus chungangensis TaxID=767452 RepID=A0A0W8IB75_9MICO|nr:hypothetical protein AVL62_15450 [Serinicoccus chungangensis]